MSEPTNAELAATIDRVLALLQAAADRQDAAAPAAPDAIDAELARPPRTTATVDLRNAPEIVAFRQALAADRMSNSLLGGFLAVIEQVLPFVLGAL